MQERVDRDVAARRNGHGDCAWCGEPADRLAGFSPGAFARRLAGSRGTVSPGATSQGGGNAVCTQRTDGRGGGCAVPRGSRRCSAGTWLCLCVAGHAGPPAVPVVVPVRPAVSAAQRHRPQIGERGHVSGERQPDPAHADPHLDADLHHPDRPRGRLPLAQVRSRAAAHPTPQTGARRGSPVHRRNHLPGGPGRRGKPVRENHMTLRPRWEHAG